jgi:chromodomain-helicase-DNA-binding protein 7
MPKVSSKSSSPGDTPNDSPEPLGPPPVTRARRNNLGAKSYQQSFTDEEQEPPPQEADEYIFYRGGRVTKILAERTRAGTEVIEKLCKFHSKSYLHVEWLTVEEAAQRDIRMVRQTRRNIQAAVEQLAEIQMKFGAEHYFNPAFTRVDRILTTAVLFPVMHHKKGSEMKGKWSESMVLVCSKMLNFEQEYVPYGVVQKDDFHAEDAQEATH